MHAERVLPVEANVSERARWIGLAASLLLHVLAVAAVLIEVRLREPPPQPVEEPIEVVFMPPPAPTPPPVPPRVLEPLPQATPPDAPQLAEAPIARESNAPRRPPAQGRQGETRQAAVPRPPAAVPQAQSLGPRREPVPQERDDAAGVQLQPGRAIAPRRPNQAPTQSLKDFILAQVVQVWPIDPRSERLAGVSFYVTITLQADGMLAPPFGKNDRFEPEQVINHYYEVSPFLQQALRSFVEALRIAQPFRLPPKGDTAYPVRLYIDFLLHDL